MKGNLKLLCRKCTREGHFVADTPDQAIRGAIEAGWVKQELAVPDPDGNTTIYVCPRCPVSISKEGHLVAE